MTDAQFGLLISAVVAGLGGIAATIRWAVGRVTNAIDDNTASNRELSKAQIDYAAAMAGMGAKLDHVSNWVHAHTPIGMDEVDEPYTSPERERRDRIKTAPHGYRPPRPGGHDD